MLISGPCSPHWSRCRRSVSLVGLLSTLLVWAPGARSQTSEDVHVVPRAGTVSSESPRVPLPPDATLSLTGKPLRVDVDLVLVPVTVTDARNRPLTGLTQKDFLLFENDERQQIQYFSTEDTPISVGVILDLSKSMANKIDTAREALADFFDNANPEDDYFVITFSDRPQVMADATRSVGSIRAKLASVTPSGHTALLDAIYLGIAKMRHSHYKRRALLIISDGGDNRSRYKAREIRSMVQEADVEIYAIGIFDSIFKTPEEWAGKRLLTDITEATGGRTITVGNINQLTEIAAAVSQELRNQYVLGYRPRNAAHDGTWRKLRVKLAQSAAAQPQVRWKKGYLAPAK